MHNRTTLSPDEAKDYGLVTEIKNTLMPSNAEFHSIGEFDNQVMQIPQLMIPQIPGFPPIGQKIMMPKNENYTSFFDRGYSFTNSYS
jgi:hypothetical protein